MQPIPCTWRYYINYQICYILNLYLRLTNSNSLDKYLSESYNLAKCCYLICCDCNSTKGSFSRRWSYECVLELWELVHSSLVSKDRASRLMAWGVDSLLIFKLWLLNFLTKTARLWSYLESSHNLLPRVYMREDLPAPGDPQNPTFIENLWFCF